MRKEFIMGETINNMYTSTCIELVNKEIKECNREGKSIRGIVSITRKLSKAEIYQLSLGLIHGIDISKYSRYRNSHIMEEVRIGLENFVDITPYITVGMTNIQVKEIRIGLMQNVDVKTYAYREIPAYIMRRIRTRLIRLANQ